MSLDALVDIEIPQSRPKLDFMDQEYKSFYAFLHEISFYVYFPLFLYSSSFNEIVLSVE